MYGQIIYLHGDHLDNAHCGFHHVYTFYLEQLQLHAGKEEELVNKRRQMRQKNQQQLIGSYRNRVPIPHILLWGADQILEVRSIDHRQLLN